MHFFPISSLRAAVAALGILLGSLFLLATSVPRTAAAQDAFGQPQIGAVRGALPVLSRVQVVDFGRVIYTGPMDVNSTVDRIRRGTKLNHRNDGSVFRNFERLLPVNADRQYYREFVHTLHSRGFPGPQRVVVGKAGEVFYTGDHYASFQRVNP